jgi:hypothetical protein
VTTQEEKQAYIDEMVRKRGYVLDYHKVMTKTLSENRQVEQNVSAGELNHS